jgi:hypothetical protein
MPTHVEMARAYKQQRSTNGNLAYIYEREYHGRATPFEAIAVVEVSEEAEWLAEPRLELIVLADQRVLAWSNGLGVEGLCIVQLEHNFS